MLCTVLFDGIKHMLTTHTHIHPFNGPLSGTTRVSRYQKGKTNVDFTEDFYRPDALPATQPTEAKHCRLTTLIENIIRQHSDFYSTLCIANHLATDNFSLISLIFCSYLRLSWVPKNKSQGITGAKFERPHNNV